MLTTDVRLVSVSDAGDTTLLDFDVEIRTGAEVVATLRTQFGFFPAASLATPIGLPTTDSDHDAFHAVGQGVPLDDRRPDGPLGLLHAVTGHWPTGGAHGRGRLRAVREVHPSDWYFRSHFFQDPVQPGSLGLQALLQALALTQPAGAGLRLVPGRPLSWTYRGQVVPTSSRVTVVVDVERVGDDQVEGRGSLWVDGVRIYEATGLSTPCVSQRTTRLRPRDVVPFWRSVCGATGPWPGEDLARALLRFVRHVRVDPAAEAQVGRPSLFLANHQVGIESAVGALTLSARFRSVVTSLAKIEHRDSWVAHLERYLGHWPRLRPISILWFVDRDDPRSLLGFGKEAQRWMDEGRSILVHVAGTRCLQAAEPVRNVSGLFLDFAVERSVPIVPVWFSGGLPRQPVAERLEFPLGMAAQDLTVGAPLAPDELAAWPLRERVRRVVDAINSLAPHAEDAHAPDPEFEWAVAEWQRLRGEPPGGAPDVRSVMLAALAELVDPCPATRRLLASLRGARPPEGNRAEDEALRVLATWLGRSVTAHD
jgi:3-hydroxymyristoyl/3-hydroxydecanoyl-(acyl carrier protein) dehydratase/1-acyl-sn-glycerol-3-phosphate acyltransferase